MNKIKPGLYKHNKGQFYRVLTIARSIKDKEPRVVFQDLVDEYETWILPLSEWNKRFTPRDVTNTGEVNKDRIGLIFIYNKQILTTRTQNRTVFFIPGGYRQNGESDMQCLKREIKLKLGIELLPESAHHYGTFVSQSYGTIPGVLTRSTFYLASCKGKLQANSKIREFAWLKYKDRDRVGAICKIIFDELYYKGMIE